MPRSLCDYQSGGSIICIFYFVFCILYFGCLQYTVIVWLSVIERQLVRRSSSEAAIRSDGSKVTLCRFYPHYNVVFIIVQVRLKCNLNSFLTGSSDAPALFVRLKHVELELLVLVLDESELGDERRGVRCLVEVSQLRWKCKIYKSSKICYIFIHINHIMFSVKHIIPGPP